MNSAGKNEIQLDEVCEDESASFDDELPEFEMEGLEFEVDENKASDIDLAPNSPLDSNEDTGTLDEEEFVLEETELEEFEIEEVELSDVDSEETAVQALNDNDVEIESVQQDAIDTERELSNIERELEEDIAELEDDSDENDEDEIADHVIDESHHELNLPSEEEHNTVPNEKRQQYEDDTLMSKDDNHQTISHTSASPVQLHNEQLSHLELSLLERIDNLITILEGQHSKQKLEEQSPAKQFATGIHYIKFENNHYLGAKWFRKAAMQGHPKAQLYLGLLFLKGEGVPKSHFHAYAWLTLAANQDLAEAKDARIKLEPHLSAANINASLKHAADILEKIHGL